MRPNGDIGLYCRLNKGSGAVRNLKEGGRGQRSRAQLSHSQHNLFFFTEKQSRKGGGHGTMASSKYAQRRRVFIYKSLEVVNGKLIPTFFGKDFHC